MFGRLVAEDFGGSSHKTHVEGEGGGWWWWRGGCGVAGVKSLGRTGVLGADRGWVWKESE